MKATNKKHIAIYLRGGDDWSVALQTEYYKEKHNHDEENEVVGFYADIGKSGLGTKGRHGLERLMADCRAGKIQEVHTKSVSRLSRNMAELIAIIKELKNLGIAVVFEVENINTLSSMGETLLAIYEAMAADENKYSVGWRIKKKVL